MSKWVSYVWSISGQTDLLDAVRIEAVSKRVNGFCAGRDDKRAFQITGQEEFTADFQTVFRGNTTHIPGISKNLPQKSVNPLTHGSVKTLSQGSVNLFHYGSDITYLHGSVKIYPKDQ